MWNFENKEKNKNKEGINQHNKNTEEGNKNNNNLLDNNLNNQNYEQCPDFQSNENSQEEKDNLKFLNKKRTRKDKLNSEDQNNLSFNKNNNSQNITENLKDLEENSKLLIKHQKIEKKVANERDKKIQKNYINNNINKQDLGKAIKVIGISINQKEDVKKIEPFYANYSPTLKKKLIKIEEKLNEKTYLITQIIENKNTENNKPNLYPSKNIYLNLKNPIEINDSKDYSVKCLTTNLNFSIYKGTSELKFKLKLENDGKFPWPKNQTILSTNKSYSNIKIKEIILDPLNPRVNCDFDVLFRNMSQLPEGKKYFSILEFKVRGKKYGNSILINVEIIDNKKKEYEQEINAIDKTKIIEAVLHI